MPHIIVQSFLFYFQSLEVHNQSSHRVQVSKISCSFCDDVFVDDVTFCRHANASHRDDVISEGWMPCSGQMLQLFVTGLILND